MVSYVLAGFVCLLAALCYAEFAAMTPVAGSAYTYAYTTLGEIFAWIIGWDLILEYAVAASTVATGWSAYFSNFLTLFPRDCGFSRAGLVEQCPPSYSTRTRHVRRHQRLHQLARRPHRPDPHRDPGEGDQGERELQRLMVAIKVGAVVFVISGRGRVHQPGELGTFRALRVDRDQLLRLSRSPGSTR